MKRRILAILLSAVMAMSMLACDSKKEAPAKDANVKDAAGKEGAETTSDDYEAVAKAADWILTEDLKALDKDQGYKVGFTDNFDGNTLHQQQEKYFQDLCGAMMEVGIVEDYTLVVANNDVATQVQQIETFIMEGCDLIIVDPCSSSGLDGAIEEAEAAGATVVVFNDDPVSSSKCYQLNVDCVANFGYLTEWCCEKLGGEGNVLVCRSVAGQSYDALAYQGITEAIAKYPNMKIVGEVYGEYNSTTAQTEIASFLGIDILDGVEVPQYMYYPMDLIAQEDLFKFEGIDDSEVATNTHDLSWVRSELETQDETACKPEMVKE